MGWAGQQEGAGPGAREKSANMFLSFWPTPNSKNLKFCNFWGKIDFWTVRMGDLGVSKPIDGWAGHLSPSPGSVLGPVPARPGLEKSGLHPILGDGCSQAAYPSMDWSRPERRSVRKFDIFFAPNMDPES